MACHSYAVECRLSSCLIMRFRRLPKKKSSLLYGLGNKSLGSGIGIDSQLLNKSAADTVSKKLLKFDYRVVVFL